MYERRMSVVGAWIPSQLRSFYFFLARHAASATAQMSTITHEHPPATIHHVGQRSEEVLFGLRWLPAWVSPRRRHIDRRCNLLPELHRFRRGEDGIVAVTRIRERHLRS